MAIEVAFGIKHLSYSSINTWLMCPRSWRFRYQDKEPAPTSPALIFGSAFHDTIEDFITREDSVPLSVIWEERWTAKVADESDVAWGDDSPASLQKTGERMFSDSDIAATVEGLRLAQPENVEKFVELRVPGVPLPIIGYVDLIAGNGIPCDFKTSSRKWASDKAASEMQPLFYLAALNQIGHDCDMRFRHYVFTKTKSPALQVFDTQRTMTEVIWLFEMIREVWQAIEAQSFAPNPTTWKCSEKWCEYWPICRGKQ